MNTNRYNQYISNKNNIWNERFTFMGLNGNTPHYKTTIVEFEKETNTLSNIPVLTSVHKLYNEIKKTANIYKIWCKTKDNYSDIVLDNIENFFIGALGEYFFTYYLNDVKCVLIKDKNTNIYNRFDFYDVCPRLIGEEDFGVDLTGIVSYKNKSYDCAFQVKFWNPYINNMFTNEIASGVFTDAVTQHFINIDDTNNIFVCWLGDTKNVSLYLQKNKSLYKYIQFIDMNVLNNTINNQMPIFWNNFKIMLNNIKTLA